MDFYSKSVPVCAWFLENCQVSMDMCVCVCAHAYTLVSVCERVYVHLCVYILYNANRSWWKTFTVFVD